MALTFVVVRLCLLGFGGVLSAADGSDAEKPAVVKEEKEQKDEPEKADEAKGAGEKADSKGAEPAAGEDAPGEKEASTKAKNSPTEDLADAEREEMEEAAAVALPVSADPVQVYGWRERIQISDGKDSQELQAKLDSGALTSSVHCENKELFERDGKKWVRFVVTDPRDEKAKRMRIEAPLVRIARIKEPGGESVAREVVRLSFRLGDRKLKADFTLNNRSNMLSPVLLGRRTIRVLGWIDPSRAYLADKKIMR